MIFRDFEKIQEMNQDKNPLVSIIVITYNSAKFVLETLESAKAQTYQNIELIISDDCSSDNTIEICKEWLKENKDRFVNTELITVEKNTGIPANCNRGVKASNGEWIKLIAGDDALIDDSIEQIINYTSSNKNINVLATQVDVYDSNFEEKSFLRFQPNVSEYLNIYSRETNVKQQIEFILKGGYHSTPGFFVKKEVFNKINYLDESFRLIEDIPMYLRFGLTDIKIDFYPIRTVKYRKSDTNLTFRHVDFILPKYMQDYYRALNKYAHVYGNYIYIVNSWYNYKLVSLIFHLGNKGQILDLINKLRISFQPIRMYNVFSKLTS